MLVVRKILMGNSLVVFWFFETVVFWRELPGFGEFNFIHLRNITDSSERWAGFGSGLK